MRSNGPSGTMSLIQEYNLNWFQTLAVRVMKTGPIPRHVAFIMDGNRRYAKRVLIERQQAHVEGYHKLAEVLFWCKNLGVTEATVYAFSIENFKRSEDEVDELMRLLRNNFERILRDKDKLMESGVCLRIIGNISLFPEDLRKLIAKVMSLTKSNDKMFLNVALAYTSRDEMTSTMKEVLKAVENNEIFVDDIDENLFSRCLYTHNSPNPDLLIRTSGEMRLSDFLMWQIADSCIYFCNALWPELSIWNLLAAVFYYQRCYPYLLHRMKMRNLKSSPIIENNSRVSIFINKFYREREDVIKNLAES